MSSQLTNESYARCIAELRARYGARGISVNVKKGAKEQIKKEEQTKTAENYYLFNSRSGIGASYRSGEYNGSKYMTSDDFVRYFKSRRPYSLPTRTEENAVASKNERAVSRKGATAREGSSDSKEGHIRRAVSAIIELKNKWLPIEAKEGRTIGARFRFPAAAMSYVAVVAFSLGLIVSGSVLIGNASGELGSLNTQITVLEARQSELQSELDLKYNIDSIKADAQALGMISGEFAGGKTLSVASEEKIEIYEQEDEKVGFAALLNAFGIDLD